MTLRLLRGRLCNLDSHVFDTNVPVFGSDDLNATDGFYDALAVLPTPDRLLARLPLMTTLLRP